MEFRQHIEAIFQSANIPSDIASLLLTDACMDMYRQAMVHPSVDARTNYELLEFLGDSVVNNCIVYYMSRRCAKIAAARGTDIAVKVLARLKINLTSKRQLAQLATMLRFLPYIQAEPAFKEANETKLCEDTFEAFFGALALCADGAAGVGAGYACAYAIIKTLFDHLEVDVSYESLFDARTRLKEVFDVHRHMGHVVFKTEMMDGMVVARAFLESPGTERVLLGTGTAPAKNDAVAHASEQALHNLKFVYNISRDVPESYRNLQMLVAPPSQT